MKGSHWYTMTLVVLLIASGGLQRDTRAALDPEPTVDEQFQDQAGSAAPSELPLPQASGVRAGGESGSGGAAYLGVTFDPSFRNAAVVRDVHPGSPAEQAGLQPGDVIEQLNGRPIRSNQDAVNDIARMRTGDVLDIGFSRRVTATTQAALNSRPAQNVERAPVLDQRALAEPVAPAGAQRVRANRPSYDNSAAQQRQSGATQNQRRTTANGNDRQPERERGLRVRGFGRR